MQPRVYRSLLADAAVAIDAVGDFVRGARGAQCVALVGLLCLSAWCHPVAAQQKQPSPFPQGIPFADPQQFFDQFFGQESEEDRQALEAVAISPREEQQFGSRGAEEYLAELRRQDIKVVSRGEEVEYLKALVETLRPYMRNGSRYASPRVHVAQSDETDARAFPGGTLIFFRGMLDFAENEAALVGVIGHELSHLDHGHQLYHVKRMKLAQDSFSGDFSPEKFFRSGAMLARSFMRPFRPEEEAEADRDGAAWAYRAGYDAREMAKLFLRLHERAGGSDRLTPAFFRSHPYHLDRYQAVLDQFQELHAADSDRRLYIGRENLRQKIPRSKREFAE